MPDWLKWFFEFQYRFSKPRWDTGITPPEVVAVIESGTIRGNRTGSPTLASNLQLPTETDENVRSALDLGCGTGTNAIYLARNGFQVVGVDFSPRAIATARDKAKREGISANFHVGDVTRLDFLQEPFDFVLDIGCFHSVAAERRQAYAAEMARLARPGALFMLYAFSPRRLLLRNVGVTVEEVKKTFAKDFALERIEEGNDRGEITSAWYWFKRKNEV